MGGEGRGGGDKRKVLRDRRRGERSMVGGGRGRKRKEKKKAEKISFWIFWVCILDFYFGHLLLLSLYFILFQQRRSFSAP